MGKVRQFLDILEEKQWPWRRVLTANTAHHTRALDPIVKPYERLIASLPLVPPQIPMISTLTGGYAAGSRQHRHKCSAAEAGRSGCNKDERGGKKTGNGVEEGAGEAEVDVALPQHWSAQMRSTVRFDKALATLRQDFPNALVVEIGPTALANLVKVEGKANGAQWGDCVPTLRQGRHQRRRQPELIERQVKDNDRHEDDGEDEDEDDGESATFCRLAALHPLRCHNGPRRTCRSRLTAALPAVLLDSDGSDNDDGSNNEVELSSNVNRRRGWRRGTRGEGGAGPDVYEGMA